MTWVRSRLRVSLDKICCSSFIKNFFVLYSNTSTSQSSQIVYTMPMKKAFFISLIALMAVGAPAFAEELPTPTKADLTASATPNLKDAPLDITKLKAEPVATRKQKIEADLRATILKLKLVIDRTQTLIDLLNKNGKDTTDASASLLTARTALDDATTAVDQFAGVVTSDLSSTSGIKPEEKIVLKKEVAPLKDPLKKAQESLKSSKSAVIESIAELKDILSPENDGQ